ncbi:MAG: hypothetical protein NTZ86_09020 [Legionellales bacterium]|nr:hypothetical protein [Legionellales bacterium]
MKSSYVVILTHDDYNRIIRISCPDLFGEEFIYNAEEHDYTHDTETPWKDVGVKHFIKGKLLDQLEFLKKNQFEIPIIQDTQNLDDILGKTELAITININFEANIGLFQNGFVGLAIVVRALSSISSGFISILALELATSSNSKATNQILPIAAAILGTIMTFVMYVYSDSIHYASESGRRLDNYIYKKPIKSLFFSSLSSDQIVTTPSKKDISDVLPYLLFTALASGDVLCTAIVTYQTVLSLGQAANEQKKSIVHQDAIAPIAICIAITTGVSLALFESGFAIAAGKHLSEKIKSGCCTKKKSDSWTLLQNQDDSSHSTRIELRNTSRTFEDMTQVKYSY